QRQRRRVRDQRVRAPPDQPVQETDHRFPIEEPGADSRRPYTTPSDAARSCGRFAAASAEGAPRCRCVAVTPSGPAGPERRDLLGPRGYFFRALRATRWNAAMSKAGKVSILPRPLLAYQSEKASTGSASAASTV